MEEVQAKLNEGTVLACRYGTSIVPRRIEGGGMRRKRGESWGWR